MPPTESPPDVLCQHNTVETCDARCPYCGANIKLVVDPASCGQPYIEDCEVCCRPIHCTLHYLSDYSGDTAEQTLQVTLLREDD